MFLSPSQVHFTSGIDSLGASKMAADSHIGEVYREMKMQRLYPRLQVVKKSGHYFTLDNTRLYMLRRMEEEGHCKLVPVDQVMLKKVPEAVQRMMVLPSDLEAEEDLTGRLYNEAVQTPSTEELRVIPEKAFSACFQRLQKRWHQEQQTRPERKRFRLRRASELAILGSPRKLKDSRDTRSVTCSLETGRRKIAVCNPVEDEDSDSSWGDCWLDETESLLRGSSVGV